ncbi:MAG: ABC transporter permease [Alphaproteobacteria bacterium]|nr:MAG: ABC transporter permease [Alphaproteobacteria bacterium]
MLRFLTRRLLSAIPVLFVVSLVAFGLMWLVPGDIAAEIGGTDATPEDLAAIRERLGLDKPVWERAVNWYGALLQGDLGYSYLLNRSVVDAVIERLPVTLSLAGLSLALATLTGMLLGILAAVRHNTLLDQGAMIVALIGLSVPEFWFGILMIIMFGVWLGWLPTGGFVPLSEDPVGWARSMVLPAFSLAVSQMGVIARMTRSAMLDVLGQDYIRTVRAKGLRARGVVFRHGLPNAMIPIVTVVGVITGVLLSGAVVIETVFSLPGVGRLIVGAIQRRDFPVVQGGLLVTAGIFVFVNLLVDVLYAAFDPRVRDGRGG